MVERGLRPGTPRGSYSGFTPLQGSIKAEVVARRLVENIALGLLPPGSQLPSETDLALQFGVSTVTLREALAQLRRLGLVETQRGRGGGSYVIAEPDEGAEILTRDLQDSSIDELRELRDLQAAISAGSAALAAERVRGVGLQRLERLATRIEEEESSTSRVRAEARFHIEIAALARSERLTQLEMSLQLETAPFIWMAKPPACKASVAATEHLAIVDAVSRGDADSARKWAHQHAVDAMNHVIEVRMAIPGGN